MKARRLFATLATVVVIIASGAFLAIRNRDAAPKAAAPAVKAAEPTDVSVPAVLQPLTTVPIGTPVEGKIQAFEVEVGAEVYEGQLLATIRSEALEAAKQTAEIDLERADARVKNLEASVSAARLEASRATADASRVRNEFDRATKVHLRQKMLLEQGATPRNTAEKAEKEFLTLEAESKKLDAVAVVAEERISSLNRELDSARKLLEGKAADLEETNQRIGSGDIISPVTGIVVSRRGQVGEDVHPSMTDLFQIATDLSQLQAVAETAPSFAEKLKPGIPALVVLAELGADALQGVISKIEGGKITVDFANPSPLVKPGLTAQVRIKLP